MGIMLELRHWLVVRCFSDASSELLNEYNGSWHTATGSAKPLWNRNASSLQALVKTQRRRSLISTMKRQRLPRSSSCAPGSARRRVPAARSPAEPCSGSPWSRSPRTPSWTCSSTESLTYSNIHSVTRGHKRWRDWRYSCRACFHQITEEKKSRNSFEQRRHRRFEATMAARHSRGVSKNTGYGKTFQSSWGMAFQRENNVDAICGVTFHFLRRSGALWWWLSTVRWDLMHRCRGSSVSEVK